MSTNTTELPNIGSVTAYNINDGDTGWVMICSALVFLMSPALGFFYAGLARAKNALSLMYLTVMSVAIVSFQWYLIGYSLTFSNTGTPFIGDSKHFLLRGVGKAPHLTGETIPASAFMLFQCMFAAITPALAFGSAAERMSLGPATLFIFLWTTLVYDIITNWVWSSTGWLYKLGVMDYAGGTPVHISSGLAAVAYAMVVGKRRDYNENVNTPHNVSFVFLGLALMWFGWLGFNAGSALAANARSVHSLICTHLSACTAAIVWVLMDYQHTRKWSIIGLCTGAVAGLATITPGSGFVSQSSSLAFGAFGSIISNIIIRYKHRLGFDDALDVFAVHYIGGLVGLVLTGIFAQRWVIALSYPDNTPLDSIPLGGWLDGNWIQVPVQLAAIASVSAWSFVITYIILVVLNKFPFLKLRLADEDEIIGTDWAEMGERAYGYLPMDEEQARIQQMEEENRCRLEEAEEAAIEHGREVNLDEHVNGTLNRQVRNPSGIDLHLHTVPSSTSTARRIGGGFNLRHLIMARKKSKRTHNASVGGAFSMEEPVILNYGQNEKEMGGSLSKELDAATRPPTEKLHQTQSHQSSAHELQDITHQSTPNFFYYDLDEAGPSTTATNSGQNTPTNIEDLEEKKTYK
ncbi:ammonium transporter AmtB-like domain-containing protein [Cokeromyces recurvatus]|uniref:ammonium transporter AmtB-like domain-containing protein n=1 Tax=Cokeromyces recurvatus TaxID=90255 RepID=UPI002220F900|nr:ammonium transporter AmtB-like domain-containing protein [Cokeromyces recurvatus]KAI7907839.1 ammonium transporter AmtB-like domain-containing protein [Cokeromyces recurvatus]